MGKDYRYGYGYAPAPQAPSLEVTINQNAAPASPAPSSHYARVPNNTPSAQASPYRPGSRPTAPPPAAPPPPPPEYGHPAYNPFWLDRFPRRENRGMFRLALVEAMLAIVILAGGIWCYRDTTAYCPYYSAIWTSAIYLINAVVGSMAAKIGSINLYMAHLVLSLVSIGMCVVSGGISARNWNLVGTYHHPQIARDEAFCLLGEHDTSRISYIFSHMDKYDFRKCLFQLKVGVAVNSVQFVVAALEVLLNMLSAFLCCKRTCTSCF